MSLVLVRHAMPAATPDQPPHQWPLSAQGREAAARLTPLLPREAQWVSSPEPKAAETLQIAAPGNQRLLTDAGFVEVHRPAEPFDDHVQERRRAWVEGRLDDRHTGWETPGQAAERFAAAIARHSGGGVLVVGTHGMVLTAWLVEIGYVPAGRAAGNLWAGLRLPDAITVEQ